ncbi:uncharacterized protein V6R79_001144 [Siganus canaliculatus]
MVTQWLAAGAVQDRSEELEPAGGGAGAMASKPIQLITSTTRNQRSTRQGYTEQCRRPGSSSTWRRARLQPSSQHKDRQWDKVPNPYL